LREALANVGKRVGLQDFQFVVVAISIQHDTGGNLAEVLGGLATVIRARFRMFQKVKALTAEGRFSAKFLAGLPFAFLVMVYSSKPSYYLNQIDDPLFAKMMGAALGLQIIGMFVMRKMINFKV
jgi:tight adherence protein B